MGLGAFSGRDGLTSGCGCVGGFVMAEWRKLVTLRGDLGLPEISRVALKACMLKNSSITPLD